MKVYFISGLGANELVFKSLQLKNVEPVHLTWIPPLRNESIESYAQRMADRIDEPDPVIIGLSFGGIVAVEIAKRIPVKKIILISSAKGKKELPPFFRMGRFIPFHKFIPMDIKALNIAFTYYSFGIKTKEEKKKLIEIINTSVKGFNSWAVDTIVNWENEFVPENLIHIHGNADKLLPYKYVSADYTINNGGHFMIVEQAEEISALLQKLIFT